MDNFVGIRLEAQLERIAKALEVVLVALIGALLGLAGAMATR